MTVPTPLPLGCLEKDLQVAILGLCKTLHLKAVHFRPAFARKGKFVTPVEGDTGSPDLLIAGNGEVLLVELKRTHTYLKPDQREWQVAIGDRARVWKPRDWNDGTILRELRALSTARPDRAPRSRDGSQPEPASG